MIYLSKLLVIDNIRLKGEPSYELLGLKLNSPKSILFMFVNDKKGTIKKSVLKKYISSPLKIKIIGSETYSMKIASFSVIGLENDLYILKREINKLLKN